MTQPRGRGAATTAAIENAAVDLALEHGYDGLTVDLICEAVGISQRTFFNHFPTKDDAILGSYHPHVDEHAARRFIVSDGPLLIDAMSLISQPTADAAPPRFRDRLRLIASSPTLMTRQMERIGRLDDELREIILLRLTHQRPADDPVEREADADMVAHLLAGAMRSIATAASRSESGEDVAALAARARDALARVIAESAPPAQP
ncbi:TetR/AcrR family transcriptional regulator [Microbacterium marinilacus]|uniref:HTH tetR-type domain-containing protein n=1 Tax=Microbacterium marinilacus TaxID=415209 RepID=A0ABP7BTJ6_9MICO|nr:TetR/AcrR family transcriptional regulator [Microbacterium marinilacus]MBY0689083.1 TetR/AcrR family transcriptional regulator [Microbacterium marinilacus]